MINPYTRHLSTPIPQSEQEDPRQVLNSAGGYVFTIDDKARLERFLILGTDGGTYYIGERDLTKQNYDFIVDLIGRDEIMVREVTTEISLSGRAYRNSPAIFVLALLFKHGKDKLALPGRLRDICRTSTHLFEFAQYIEFLGGWGRSKRTAVADWYASKSPDQLAFQAIKYRQRDGWTHRDLFRLSHPKGVDTRIGSFILKGENPTLAEPDIIDGFHAAQAATTTSEILRVLDAHPKLPWEALPTQFHKEPEVWRKLFYNGALAGQALVRNVTRFARLGLMGDMVFARDYATKLTDGEMIKRTRLHPINYLNALVVYTEGQVQRRDNMWGYGGTRNKDWKPASIIVDALNNGFYDAFQYVEPAGKRTLIGLDVSGSMSSPALGLDLSCAQVTAAMSMTIARTEPYYEILGFAHEFRDLGISATDRLDAVVKKVQLHNFGGTDCSLPMTYAASRQLEVDTFIVMTDNETWAGNRHPHVALRDYRKQTGIDARLVVAGIASTGFTIADPTDRGMLDIVGADSNLPKLVAEFSAGRI